MKATIKPPGDLNKAIRQLVDPDSEATSEEKAQDLGAALAPLLAAVVVNVAAAAALSRLFRRLHDAGFDVPPLTARQARRVYWPLSFLLAVLGQRITQPIVTVKTTREAD